MPEQEVFAIPRLRPQISLLAGVALAIGMVVGSGLFGLPGLALQAGSPQEAAVGWLVAAMASVPLVWVFAVLGARFASAAGLAYYAEIALGPSAAFAVSSVLLGTFALGVPGLAMIGASYALPFLGLEATALLPIAAVFILLAVLFNIAGVKTSNAVNCLSLLLMVLAIVLLGFLPSGRIDDRCRSLASTRLVPGEHRRSVADQRSSVLGLHRLGESVLRSGRIQGSCL